MVGNWGEVVTR